MDVSIEPDPVPLTTANIAGHPALHAAIRRQSQLLLQAFDGSPRLSSVFGTQHRWLIGQTALALYFRSGPEGGGRGIRTASLLDLVEQHGVASRNTADAFLKEMLKYGFAQPAPESKDRRARPIEPTAASLDALRGWLGIHLGTLDMLDGGRRLETFLADAGSLAVLQPLIADALLASTPVRQPTGTFSLFTWLNNGGQVMDWLIAGIDDAAPEAERIPTGVMSIGVMAQRLKLSPTHLARKLREAEALGSIGWQGRRGHSVMWVSSGFRREYTDAQAVKLAIIDAAFDACFRPRRGGKPRDTARHPAARGPAAGEPSFSSS